AVTAPLPEPPFTPLWKTPATACSLPSRPRSTPIDSGTFLLSEITTMQRRSFLTWATHGLAALFGAFLSIPCVAYLIDARNRPAREGDFKKVARLQDLVIDQPKEVVIRETRQDAWTLHPDEVIGRVWIVCKDKTKGQEKVEVFTSICPHL